MMANLTLNLGDALANFPVSRLNGPGLRYTFWVQGCSVRCTEDCLNPAYLASVPKVLLPVDDVAAYILRLKREKAIEGVTFLGGEPFDQAVALAALGRTLQAADLSIVTYTGHTLEELQQHARPGWLDLLGVTDILIDGPYIPALHDDALRWRGSRNQRLLFLTPRYTPGKILNQPPQKGFNVIMRPDGTLKLSGMQNKQALRAMMNILEEKGIVEV